MLKKIFSSMLLLGVLSTNAHSAEVSISKLRVNLEKGQNADFIVLQNKSETDKQAYEVSLQKWQQEDVTTISKEIVNFYPTNKLTDTKTITISPKTLIIPPNGEKIVRIILNDREKAEADYSYRLLITQLPNKDVKLEANTINLLFKISLPVFVLKDKIKTADKFAILKSIVSENNKKYVHLKNNDTQHIQIQGIGLDKELASKSSTSFYLLPNSSAKIELSEQLIEAKSFIVITDKGLITVENK